MENKTAEGIALEFCEIFQNNYPEKPIHRMMVDLAKEIKTYASLQCAEMKEENERLRNTLFNCRTQIEFMNDGYCNGECESATAAIKSIDKTLSL